MKKRAALEWNYRNEKLKRNDYNKDPKNYKK